jgi:polyisoprenyl-phosphate glycosyltransferase
MSEDKSRISIVVPVFNEEAVIELTLSRLLALSDRLAEYLITELIFVDDGSSDATLTILRDYSLRYSVVRVLSFSRNFGHQAAVTAGIEYATGDYVALIDADLQDPPELIEEMYHMIIQGYDVVYGQRISREGESLFKKITASLFYRSLNYLCDIEIPVDTGDFRLMTRKAVDAFSQLRESHRFIRGMVPWVGFKSVALPYRREERAAGYSKYPLSQMFKFAGNAVLSFSTKPMSLVIRLGGLILFLSLLFSIYVICLRLFTSTVVPGFTVMITMMVMMSGVQILIMGIVGAYVGKIFEEVKRRPLYIVDEKLNF